MILRWISYLPLSVLYWVSTMLYIIIFHMVRYRYQVVRENMQNAFPDKDSVVLEAEMKQFYRNFCDFIIEALKSITISAKELEKRVTIKDPEVIEQYFKSGKSHSSPGNSYLQ